MSIESVTPSVERYKKCLAVVLYFQNTLSRRRITSAVRLCIRLCVSEADLWLVLRCSLLPAEGSAEPRMTLVKRPLGGLHLPLLEGRMFSTQDLPPGGLSSIWSLMGGYCGGQAFMPPLPLPHGRIKSNRLLREDPQDKLRLVGTCQRRMRSVTLEGLWGAAHFPIFSKTHLEVWPGFLYYDELSSKTV